MPTSVNTGYIAYSNLEEYFLDNGENTGNIVFNLPDNPNYVVPYYDPIQCPPPSPTPSITPSPTPSPASYFEVFVNAKVNGILLNNETASIYYKIDSGPWSPVSIGDVQNGWCNAIASINTAPYSTVYLAMTTGSSQDISFAATESNNCSNLTISSYCGKSTPYSIYVDSNKDVSLGAKVVGNQLALCNLPPPSPSVTPTVTPSITVSPQALFTGTVTSRWLKALPLGCGSGASITVTGNGTTFCNSTQFYSTSFPSAFTGQRYALQYSGYALEITTNGTNYAPVTAGCISCGPPSATPSVTPTPTPSPSTGATPTITDISTGMFSCATPNDYVGFGLELDIITPVNVNYTLQLTMYDTISNSFAYYAYVNGTILAGQSIDSVNIDPCDGGGVYVGGLYYVYDVCIFSVDPTVTNPYGTC